MDEYLEFCDLVKTSLGYNLNEKKMLQALHHGKRQPFLIIDYDTFNKQFPTIFRLLTISQILVASSVPCERAFSTQNIIKSKLRNN